MGFLLQYIDVIWLILAIFVVDKKFHWSALGFISGCMILLRMQVELMYVIKFPYGMLNFITMTALERGLIFYSLVYMVYFALLHFSRDNDKSIIMASSIGMFFLAFALSSVLMVL